MVWLGSWAIHWPNFARDFAFEGNQGETLFLLAIAMIIVLPVSSMTLGILSFAMTPSGEGAGFDGRDVRVVLGYSAAPHLLLGSLAAWGGAEAFGPIIFTGLPGGAGIGGAIVMAFWAVVGATEDSDILWYIVPAVLTVWSARLTIVGISGIGAIGRREIARTVTVAIVVSAVAWTFIGFPLSVLLYALSFGPG